MRVHHHVDRLEAAHQSGKPTCFSESKRWVTGAKLLAAARKHGLRLPIVFADAADCSKLLCWGELHSVKVDDDGTEFVVVALRRLRGNHAPQDLTLLRSGRKIAPNFIRPYALCRTPAFLARA